MDVGHTRFGRGPFIVACYGTCIGCTKRLLIAERQQHATPTATPFFLLFGGHMRRGCNWWPESETHYDTQNFDGHVSSANAHTHTLVQHEFV